MRTAPAGGSLTGTPSPPARVSRCARGETLPDAPDASTRDSASDYTARESAGDTAHALRRRPIGETRRRTELRVFPHRTDACSGNGRLSGAHASLVVVLAGAAMFGPGGTGVAFAAWSQPLTLEHPVSAVAGNARREEAFIWQVTTSAKLHRGSSALRVAYVQARLRLGDGRLTSPQTLSRTKRTAVRTPTIGLDARGTATAVWTEIDRDMRVAIMVAVRPSGGRFGRPIELGRAQVGDDVKMAVAEDGAAMIVRLNPAEITAFQRPLGRCVSARACFGAVQVIYSLRCSPIGLCHGIVGGPFESLDVMFGPGDRGYVAWLGVGGARVALLRGRRFGRPLAIPTAGNPPTLAAMPDGRALLAWFARSNRNFTLVRTAVSNPDGRRLSAAQTVSSPWPAGWDNCANLQLRANRQGETTLVWECLPAISGAHRMIAAAVRRADDDWGPGAAISPPASDAAQPVLAVDPEGTTILVYNAHGTILSHVRGARQDFDAAVALGTGLWRADFARRQRRPLQALAAGGIITAAWPGLRPVTTTFSDWNP